MADNNKNMFGKVKRSFLRMTTPFEFGKAEKRFSTVLSVNIPHMLACADAATERADEILQCNLFALSDKPRETLYSEANDLLQFALREVLDAHNYASADKKKLDLSPYVTYLERVIRMLDLLRILAAEQGDLPDNIKILQTHFGAAAGKELNELDNAFSESELMIAQLLADYLRITGPGIKKLREGVRQSLAKPDLERYAHAYSSAVSRFLHYGTTLHPTTDSELDTLRHGS